jgi:hypothetical protein
LRFLDINSRRLVVLDTKDSEDAAYYGTAFLLTGGYSWLLQIFYKVAAASEKGTEIKIPINYAESVSENSFIHFLSPKKNTILKWES